MNPNLSSDVILDPVTSALLARRNAGEKLTQAEYGKLGAGLRFRTSKPPKRPSEEIRRLREELSRAKARSDALAKALMAVLSTL